MHRKSILVCCAIFLTSPIVYAEEKTLSKQQVDAVQPVQLLQNATTSVPRLLHDEVANKTDKMQAEESKVTAFVEGGPVPAKVTPTPIMNATNTHIAGKSTNSTSISSSTAAVNEVTSRQFGREHMPANPPAENTAGKDVDVKPVVENQKETVTSDENKKPKVVARKGVDDLPSMISTTSLPVSANANITNVSGVNITSTTTTTTTTTSTSTTTTTTTTTTPKPPPKKPLVTIGNDEPFAPSHFVSSKKNGSTKTVSQIPNMESYDFSKEKASSSDYIVPIVGVILSVPLVSVLLNFIYKRTKEWWHHRHYSRMDFLIDGMYNN